MMNVLCTALDTTKVKLRVESIQGFVLHAKDYRDTSQLVDIFCEEFGRVRLVAKGSRSHKKNSYRLSPFNLATLSWTGRSELKTLTSYESNKTLSLSGESLICGFYINELLWHLLQPEDSHPQLYHEYKKTLFALNTASDIEPLLRHFEFNLLNEVGYGVSFEYDSEGEFIEAESHYLFTQQVGWQRVSATIKGALEGRSILEIEPRGFSDQATRRVCKQITRAAIDELLEGKKLHSRELISQLKS